MTPTSAANVDRPAAAPADTPAAPAWVRTHRARSAAAALEQRAADSVALKAPVHESDGSMQRIATEPRRNLVQRARETSFELLSIDGEVYWDETAHYSFSLLQIERHIEGPTQELADLCLALVDRVVADEHMLERLRIPPHAWDLIAESWRRRDATLYGRFDLAYDGQAPARLLEYNADTPTALFEAAVFQWAWLLDALESGALPSGSDQFNSLHEKLIARFRAIATSPGSAGRLHLSCAPQSIEDRGVISYLEDCARQAGFVTEFLGIGDIGTTGWGPFVDLSNEPIRLLFKLYPWEWMFADAFSRSPSMGATRFVEPPWKALLSNKGILPLLWEMAPRHPNLLPAYFEDDPRCARLDGRYAKKPLYSREGQNVLLVDGSIALDRDGGLYGNEGFILQQLAMVPNFDGNYPVIGSWVIGDEPGGIGIREDISPITKNTSRFLPHAIEP
jgi:glutathionylspermidine synthase